MSALVIAGAVMVVWVLFLRYRWQRRLRRARARLLAMAERGRRA